MPESTKSELKLVVLIGSIAAVPYFGLDRTIPWLPKFVHYGIAGGAITALLTHEPDSTVGNTFIAGFGTLLGIFVGEAVNFLM